MVDSQSKHLTVINATSSSSESENDELQRLEHAPPFWKSKKKLSKQLSMCETPRDRAWERRRRQILNQQQKSQGLLADEDLNELKGSIELGFGFNEEDGQRLCNTLPALDLYFAVNRQFSVSPMLSPGSGSSATVFGSSSSSPSIGSGSSPSLGSPRDDPENSWKICNPGDDPQQVKTKLRHWAQAVACSVLQSH